MRGRNPVNSTSEARKGAGEDVSSSPLTDASPFPFLKWTAGVVFALALVAAACAGTIYADLLALRERVQPETWAAYFEGDSPPFSGHIGFFVFVSLSLAMVAAIIYVFAELSDRLCRKPGETTDRKKT